MGAGAAGGAVMGVLRDAGAGGGGDECRGAILGGGDAARPRRGIVYDLKQEMLFDDELAQTQENGDKNKIRLITGLIFALGSGVDASVKGWVDNIQHQ